MNLADDTQLLHMLRDANFFGIFVGIESPDTDTLIAMQKKQNTRRDLVESIHKLYDAGIVVIAGFIVGFDTEEKRVAQGMIDCIEAMSIPVCMVGPADGAAQHAAHAAARARAAAVAARRGGGRPLHRGAQLPHLAPAPRHPRRLSRRAGGRLRTGSVLPSPAHGVPRLEAPAPLQTVRAARACAQPHVLLARPVADDVRRARVRPPLLAHARLDRVAQPLDAEVHDLPHRLLSALGPLRAVRDRPPRARDGRARSASRPCVTRRARAPRSSRLPRPKISGTFPGPYRLLCRRRASSTCQCSRPDGADEPIRSPYENENHSANRRCRSLCNARRCGGAGRARLLDSQRQHAHGTRHRVPQRRRHPRGRAASTSRAACRTSPGATSAGRTTGAGSTASTSASIITGRRLICPTSASPRSAFPLSASSPPTTGAAGTGAAPGTPSTRVGKPSSGTRASAGMLRLRVRAMRDGGVPATWRRPACMPRRSTAGVGPSGMTAARIGAMIAATITMTVTTTVTTTTASSSANPDCSKRPRRAAGVSRYGWARAHSTAKMRRYLARVTGSRRGPNINPCPKAPEGAAPVRSWLPALT